MALPDKTSLPRQLGSVIYCNLYCFKTINL